MIIEKYTDPAGFVRVLWRTGSGNDVWFKFREDPSLLQLQNEETRLSESLEHSDVTPLIFDFLNEKDILIKALLQLRSNPSLTLTQYNNYLATLPWYEAAIIRVFVYAVGREMARRGEISPAGMTEAQFLAAVRDFFVNTPLKKLSRLIFGVNNALS